MLDISSKVMSEPKVSKTKGFWDSRKCFAFSIVLYSCFTLFTEYTEFNGGAKMPNITLSVSEDLKKEMESLPEINWSEVTREFLSEKVKRLAFLKKLEAQLESKEEQELTKWSVELGRKAKKGRYKRLLAELSPERRKELLSKLSPEKRRKALE